MSGKIKEPINQQVDWDAIGGINGGKLDKEENRKWESINNLPLIKNGLQHLIFEHTSSSPSDFRVAREAYLILYRAMIEALRGSANQNIIGYKNKNKMQHFYRFDEPQWCEIHKETVKSSKKPWRFSAPAEIPAPTDDRNTQEQEWLIDFYEALAKIQAECFMKQYCDSKTVPVTDEEMMLLEWLHNNVRNEHEHFIPKCYAVCRESSIRATSLCLRLSQELLFESGNAIFSEHEQAELMQLFVDAKEAIENKLS